MQDCRLDKKPGENIGRRLNVTVNSLSSEQAMEQVGFLGRFAAPDCPASSEPMRMKLDWQPRRLGLLAEPDQAYYF